MGVTKKYLFSTEQNDLAMAAKALAHPARIAIIEHLLKANACITGDLVDELGLAQATISQHLRELKSIGLIQGTIEGTRVSYCINPNTWNAVRSGFEELFSRFDDVDPDICC
jgi:predicted transcriptional regulator